MGPFATSETWSDRRLVGHCPRSPPLCTRAIFDAGLASIPALSNLLDHVAHVSSVLQRVLHCDPRLRIDKTFTDLVPSYSIVLCRRLRLNAIRGRIGRVDGPLLRPGGTGTVSVGRGGGLFLHIVHLVG